MGAVAGDAEGDKSGHILAEGELLEKVPQAELGMGEMRRKNWTDEGTINALYVSFSSKTDRESNAFWENKFAKIVGS